MNTAEIERKISAVCQLGVDRKAAFNQEGIPFELIQDSFFYLTGAEKGELHDLKQSLPSFSQQRIDAKNRMAARIAARKLARQQKNKEAKS